MGEAKEHPRRLYPRVSALVFVVGGSILLVGLVLLVLNLGGPNAPAEGRGDLTYIQGEADPNRPQQGQLVASVADVTDAQVKREDDQLVFMAEVATGLPQPLKISALEFRWDLAGDDGSTWTVAATIDKTNQATVFSTEGFGAGTVDDTLPGGVSVEGDVIEVRINTEEIPDFPTTFDWSLSTNLRAFRHETDSPRVQDTFPDESSLNFEP